MLVVWVIIEEICRRLPHIDADTSASRSTMRFVNSISVFGPLDQNVAERELFVDTVKALFKRSMDPELLDDRLDQQWRSEIITHNSYRAILCQDDATHPIALLEHWTTDGGSTRLEVLLDNRLTVGASSTQTTVEGESILNALTASLVETLAGSPHIHTSSAELWARPTSTPVEQFLTALHAKLSRHLFQMRASASALDAEFVDESSGFTMADRDDVIRINNNAFAQHPDQGDMSVERFDRLTSESWFRPDGIRLWRQHGEVVAFCWTKVHTQPHIGEIYVVGVDPEKQGQGLGKLVTAAGIRWLQDQQHDEVMLYVEATNAAAVAVYERLGFHTVRTDKAWELSLSTELFQSDSPSESTK